MSRYSGRQGRGARKKVKALKQHEAVVRQEAYNNDKKENESA